MAQGDVVISIAINEKEIDDVLKRIERSVNVSCDKIAGSFDKMISNIESGFKRLEDKKLSDIAGKASEKLNTMSDSVDALNASFGAGLTTLDQYLQKIQSISSGSIVAGIKPTTTPKLEEATPATANINQLNNALNEQKGIFKEYIQSLTQTNDGLKSMSKYYSEIEKESLSSAKEQARAANIAGKAIEQQNKERERAIRLAEKEKAVAAKKAVVPVGEALGMSDKSINDRIIKIKELEKVQKSLNSTDKNYTSTLKQVNQEIQRLKKANSEALTSGVELEKRTNKLSQAFQNLGNRMLVYASVGAAIGFVKSLVQIRAEYQLIERSLGAIIQDYDKATQIFKDQQKEALKSPFTLVQLTTATKQLAAYRIAVDDLVPTTKMLADISAGLGVEMERLVYNFGQVKAQTVLNARDLRDFANMGLPVLQELTKYYSQLEDRIVSTGEVFQRVSNRMVSFGDVERILKQLTSEGGQFFNMQAIQAETLHGQLNNLQDAYEQMLNAIGKENQGVLSTAVATVRTLVDNWQKVLNTIKQIVYMYGAYKAAAITARAIDAARAKTLLTNANIIAKSNDFIKIFTAGLRGQAAATKAADAATSGLNKQLMALAKNPYAIIAAALVAIGFAIYKAWDNATKLNREINKLANEGTRASEKSAWNFQRLANEITNATDGSKEQTHALNELKRTYEDILPAQALTVAGLREMKGNYDAVTNSIYDKIKAQTLEKQITAVTEYYEPQITTAEDSITEYLKKKGIDEADVPKIIQDISNAINKGLIDMSTETGENIADIIYARTGKILDVTKDVDNYKDTLKGLATSANTAAHGMQRLIARASGDFKIEGFYKLHEALIKLNEEQDELYTSTKHTSGQYYQFTDTIKQVKDNISATIASMSQLANETQYAFDERKTTKAIELWGNSIVDIFANINKEYGSLIKELSVSDIATYLSANIEKIPERYREIFSTIKKDKSLNIAVSTVVEDVNRTIVDLLGSPQEQAIKKRFESLAKSIGLSMDDVTKYLKKSEQGTQEWVKNLQDSYQALTADIKAFNESGGSIITGFTQSQIDKMSLQAQFILELIKQLDKSFPGGGAKNTELERLKEQLSLIKKLVSEYDKLTKSGISAGNAINIMATEFGDKMEKLLPAFKVEDIVKLDSAGIAKFITDNLKKGLKTDEAKIEVGVVVSEYTIEGVIDVQKAFNDALDKSLGDIQAGYEIGIELEGKPQAFQNAIMDILQIDPTKVIRSVDDAITLINKELSASLGKIVDISKMSEEETLKFFDIPKDSDTEKRIKEIYKFITSARDKERKDLIKNYESLLEKYADYEYRRKAIAMQAEKELADLRTRFREDESSSEYKRLAESITSRAAQETSKLSFEQFKGTDAWITAFEDLNRVSTQSISAMITQLEKFKQAEGKNLDPTNLREYMNTLKKLREELEDRTPFTSFINGIKEANAAQEALAIKMGEQGYTGTGEQFVADALALQLQTEHEISNIKVQRLEIENQIATLIAEGQGEDSLIVIQLRAQIAELERLLAEAQIRVSYTSGIVDLGNKVAAGWDKAMRGANKFGGSMKTVIGNAKRLAAVFGMETDSIASDLLDLTDELIDVGLSILPVIAQAALASTTAITTITTTTVAGEVAIVTISTVAATAIKTVESASVILAIIGAALAIATAIANIFIGRQGKKLDAAIKRSENRLKSLQNAYRELERAIDRAMGTAEIGYKQSMIANLELQRIEIQRQIQIEKSRKVKKKDIDEHKARLADLQQQYVELGHQIEDTQASIVEGLLGTDVKSFAENLVSDMIEAWKMGEDYMATFEQSFEEMWDHMLMKMIVSRVIGDRIQKIFDDLDAVIAKRTQDVMDLTVADILKEWKAAGKTGTFIEAWIELQRRQREALENAGPTLEDYQNAVAAAEGMKEGALAEFEALMDMFGIAFGSAKEAELSGLQKGIAGITEQTAGELESRMNILTFNSYESLDLQRQMLLMQQVHMSMTSNLLLTARESYQLMQGMYGWMQSITAATGGTGGSGIKVYLEK